MRSITFTTGKETLSLTGQAGTSTDCGLKTMMLHPGSQVTAALLPTEGCMSVAAGAETVFFPLSLAAIAVATACLTPSDRMVLAAQGVTGLDVPAEIAIVMHGLIDPRSQPEL